VNIDSIFIVDDSQRLGNKELPLSLRLPIVVEQLQQSVESPCAVARYLARSGRIPA